MKRFLLAACTGLILSAGSVEALPKIFVSTSRLDFGTLYQGQTVTRRATIRNTGDANLIIEHIDPSCECSRPSIAKNTLKPGESTTLTVTFDGKLYDGTVNKFFLIVSNDAGNRNARVEVHAFVKKVFDLEPRVLHLSVPDSAGLIDTAVTILRNVTEKKIWISGLADSAGRVHAWTDKPGIQPGGVIRLYAVPTGGISPGAIGQVTVLLKKSPVTRLHIPYVFNR